MRFSVKNTTGETWPAYGIARLGSVVRYDGPNDDIPLYSLKKPDGEDGIYVVNGNAALEDDSEGVAIHYMHAEYVFVSDSAVSVGTVVGALKDEWHASDADGNKGQFYTVDGKNADDVAPVIPIASAGVVVSTGKSGTCPCDCIDAGDMEFEGIETTSRWSVDLPALDEQHPNGRFVYPGGTVTVDFGTTYWEQDIGDDMIAYNNNDDDVTSLSTLSGTVKFWLKDGVKTKLEVCLSASIPPASGY